MDISLVGFLFALLTIHGAFCDVEFKLEIKSQDAFVYTNKSVVFADNSTRCNMLGHTCKIVIFCQEGIDPTVVTHKARQQKFFKYLRTERCRGDTGCSNVTQNGYQAYFVEIEAIVVGKNSFFIKYQNFTVEHKMIIMPPKRTLDSIHQLSLLIYQIVIALFMGMLLDLNVMRKIIKTPKALLAGFICQYGGMPLVAYGIAKIASLTPVDSLALFVLGCCPGGTASNNWTLVLDGDIDLSVIMTFISTMGSLILMPAWIYSLGSEFADASSIKIPFVNLILNLFISIGSCLFGLALSHCFPKMKPWVLKIAKPVTLVTLIGFLIFSIYVKYYAFALIGLKQWIFPPLLPWVGFIFSGLVALLLGLPKPQVITVSLETGIQNIGIAFMVILGNFPSPESDYAILPVVTASMFTSFPMYLWLIYAAIRDKLKKPKEAHDETNNDEESKNLNQTTKE